MLWHFRPLCYYKCLFSLILLMLAYKSVHQYILLLFALIKKGLKFCGFLCFWVLCSFVFLFTNTLFINTSIAWDNLPKAWHGQGVEEQENQYFFHACYFNKWHSSCCRRCQPGFLHMELELLVVVNETGWMSWLPGLFLWIYSTCLK